MPKLIHVVDDDSSFRTAIQRRLLKAGYEVEIYASAQDLLDRRPDERRTSCILLDIRVPDLSGPELQQRLKDLGSTLPIVFLSGHADLQTTVQTIKAGADDVLSKPVDSERLLKAIEDAITRHEGLRKQQATLDAY
jgi:FixJ family two-component response regulator